MNHFYLRDLIVTQRDLRTPDQLISMTEFAEDGGIFNCEILQCHNYRNTTSPLIQLARFEDGQIYIRDGHHRLVAIYRSGRQYISEEEYVIREWEYRQWLTPNLKVGWVTPFDPRIQIRVGDLGSYKKELSSIDNDIDKLQFIKDNVDRYAIDRDISSIAELSILDRLK